MDDQLLHQIVRELERVENGHPDNRSSRARELVQQLITLFGSAQVAALAMGLSPATFYRLRKGQISLRQLARIRLALTKPSVESHLQQTTIAALPQRVEAIHSVDFIFDRAAFVKNIFVFKSFLEFQAADSEPMLGRLQKLFESNPQVRMYLVFPEGSKAEETANRFYELAVALGEEWISRIHRCSVADPDETLSLGLGYTGPVVLEYNDEGTKRWRKLLDVFVELPVKLHCENGETNTLLKGLAWIELPSDSAHQLFTKWKKFLERPELAKIQGPQSAA